MRKNTFLIVFAIVLFAFSGCTMGGSVKVYGDVEGEPEGHTEAELTALVLNIDQKNNLITFRDCRDGAEYALAYHGGVSVVNTYGNDVGISGLGLGMVCDIVFYTDTKKLASIVFSDSDTVLEAVTKLAVDKEAGKAVYKGISRELSEYAAAFNQYGELMELTDVNSEDEVTLHVYANRIVSVVVTKGHGYVRLKNQDTYVGGMVEIGRDVIVPVTKDMLVPVREGDYTLRINKNGYSNSMEVSVAADAETVADIKDIAIPAGTATFDIEPEGAQLYISGALVDGRVYSSTYGTYALRVEADGYKPFRGSFKIAEEMKNFTIELTKLEDESDDPDTSEEGSSSEETTEEADITEEGIVPPNQTSESEIGEPDDESIPVLSTTEKGVTTDNDIIISSPVGAYVYVDGNYEGIAPVTVTKVTGIHTITLYKAGYLIKSYTIQAVDDGNDDEYNFVDLVKLLDIDE